MGLLKWFYSVYKCINYYIYLCKIIPRLYLVSKNVLSTKLQYDNICWYVSITFSNGTLRLLSFPLSSTVWLRPCLLLWHLKYSHHHADLLITWDDLILSKIVCKWGVLYGIIYCNIIVTEYWLTLSLMLIKRFIFHNCFHFISCMRTKKQQN